MLASVYRLRANGVKLPRPEEGVVGELSLKSHTVGTNDPQALLAELLLPGKTVTALPPLHLARVRAITRAGLVIRGVEIIGRETAKARVRRYPQTWWCLVLTEEVLSREFDEDPFISVR